jgi:hypothetical protein
VDPSSQYAVNTPDVVAESFDGQTVILNLANGHYFSLRGIATPIWSALLAGHTPKSILASVRGSRPELLEASHGFLEQLVTLNLVRPQDTGHGDLLGPIDATWSDEGPHIEIFDDLAELIYADPIHDVDEQAGWPTPRPTELNTG